MQWLASGLGGYLTGRLRTKWVRTHTHEVFFRDTAHGFLTWAAATVVTAVVLASATTAAIGTGVQVAGTVAAGAAQGAASSAVGSVDAYDVDTLFRSSRPDANSSAADARAETTHVLTKNLPAGDFSADDRTYLAQLIAARTRLSQEDAEKRLDQTTAQIKAADPNCARTCVAWGCTSLMSETSYNA